MSITSLWEDIERQLEALSPAAQAALRPGAAADAIARAERKLGVLLPPEFRASLLRHDGHSWDGAWLIDGGRLLALSDLLSEWRAWNELLDGGELGPDRRVRADAGVAAVWWQRGWVPFVERDGDCLCLDMAPTANGARGQVISVWHDMEVRRVVAANYADWLALWLADLSDGRFRVDDSGPLITLEGKVPLRCWPHEAAAP